MKAKKTVYITCATFLGILLSYVLHAAVEIWYLMRLEKLGLDVQWYNHFGVGSCALPPVAQYGLIVIGIVGGFLLGQTWWRIVYVERRHWRFKKDNHAS